MEQLGGREIDVLLARARAHSADRPHPWGREQRSAEPPAAPGRSGYPPPPGAAILPPDEVGSLTPLGGIERRLVLRAERLWHRLRGADEIPTAEAAAALLSEPFARHALLIVAGPAAPDQLGPAADILYIGDDVARLGLAAEGRVMADDAPDAQLDGRLAALARAAIGSRRPERFSSESICSAPGSSAGSLLLRAIALPVAVDALDGAAIVILSWRKLLSPEETLALHHELEAAMDWILRQRADRH
jgi:hypothetical protein